MVRIELHTEVEEVIPAEDVPGFRVKKIDLGGIRLETPVRTIYTGTDMPARIRREVLVLKDKKRTLLRLTEQSTGTGVTSPLPRHLNGVGRT